MPRTSVVLSRFRYDGTVIYDTTEQYTRKCILPDGRIARTDGQGLWRVDGRASWFGDPPAGWDESRAVDAPHVVSFTEEKTY